MQVALDPSVFADGACMALAPTTGNRADTVFLDAGHGGVDPGALGRTSDGTAITEAGITLKVELGVAELLRSQGFRVVVSRTTDSTVVRLRSEDVASDGELSLQGAHDDVVARDRCADLAGADVLVGIYFDSGSSPSNAGSLTAFDAVRPFASASRRLATLLQTDTLAAMDAQGWAIPDAGVVNDDRLGSLVPTSETTGVAAQAATYHHLLLLGPPESGFQPDPSEMPGSIIEPLFLTDPFEAQIAASSRGVSVMAGAIAKAVEQFLPPTSSRRG